MGFEFERVTPESVGVPSAAVEETIKTITKTGAELHSFKLLRHGKVYAEAAFAPYRMDSPHILFSLSKSFTSTAIGFAVQEGDIDLDERLVDIFPELTPPNPSENLQKCTVRHLLMMGCGHETEIASLGTQNPDWQKAFMEQPFVFEPGTKFLYNTAGTNMLCAILKKKTGKQLTEYLTPRLYAPLDMQGEIKCKELPDGIEAGGFGYKHTSENLTRFAQFVANRGEWQGKQLLNKEWFDMALSKQIRNDDSGNPNDDWQQGYGFQFWMCKPDSVVRGDGAFGQYLIMLEKQDAVVVINSATVDMQSPMDAIWEILLPAFEDASLPENEADYKHLCYFLENTKLPTMVSARMEQAEKVLNGLKLVPKAGCTAFTNLIGGVGRLKEDSGEVKSLSFEIAEPVGKAYLCVEETERSYRINLGMQSEFVTTEIDGEPFAANARMRAQNKLEAEIRNITTASGTRFIFEFAADEMRLYADSSMPVFGGLADTNKPVLSFEYAEGGEAVKMIN